MTRIRCLIFAVWCVFAVLPLGWAQGQNETGLPLYGSFERSGFDVINNENLNINFSLPILSLRGRGINLNYALSYNSSFWGIMSIYPSKTWSSMYGPQGAYMGWSHVSDVPWGYVSGDGTTEDCWPGERYGFWVPVDHYQGFSYVDAAGTVHKFNGIDFYEGDWVQACQLPAGIRTGYASDGSGYFIDATNSSDPVVIAPDGTTIQNGSISDTNGNTIQATGTDYVDSLGRTGLRITFAGTQVCQDDGTNNCFATDYQYQDSTGTYQTIRLIQKYFTITTAFNCSGIGEFSFQHIAMPVQLTYPNGRSYKIDYEPSSGGAVTGRLKRVTLPTGGYYEYAYGSVDCSTGELLGFTKTVNDGTTSSQWQFVHAKTGTFTSTTTVTLPQLPYDTAPTIKYHYFNYGREVSDQTRQADPVFGQVQTVWRSDWAVPKSKNLSRGGITARTEMDIDDYGNVTATREFDWGASSTPVRTTTITYWASADWQNIRNRPSGVLTAGTSGVESKVDITYDQKGNVLSSTSYKTPTTSSGPVKTTYSLDSYGNVLTTSVAGIKQQESTFSEATKWAFPDQVKLGSSGELTSSYTYYFPTGLVHTTTDPNNNVVTYSYDPMNQPTKISRVVGSNTVDTTYEYDDAAGTVKITTPVDAGKSLVTTVFSDGLGRPIRKQIKDGAGNVVSTVDTIYDLLGRAYKVSNPYTGESATNWSEKHFDPLGRLTLDIAADGKTATSYTYVDNTVTITDPTGKQRKQYFDALGRLIRVDEPGTAQP